MPKECWNINVEYDILGEGYELCLGVADSLETAVKLLMDYEWREVETNGEGFDCFSIIEYEMNSLDIFLERSENYLRSPYYLRFDGDLVFLPERSCLEYEDKARMNG